MAPYFLEEVRKYLEAKYGAKALYESGLTVSTPLDMRLQQAANRAVDRGLRRDRQAARASASRARNVLAEKPHASTASGTIAGSGRLPRATSCRRWLGGERHDARRCASGDHAAS